MDRRVKALMVLKDVKQADICRALKVSDTLLSLVVSGKKKSARVRLAIAKALGMKVKDLWPEEDGKPAPAGKKAA